MGIVNFLRNYQRMARFRWGNFEGMKGPGPVWLVPIIHSGTSASTCGQRCWTSRARPTLPRTTRP